MLLERVEGDRLEEAAFTYAWRMLRESVDSVMVQEAAGMVLVLSA